MTDRLETAAPKGQVVPSEEEPDEAAPTFGQRRVWKRANPWQGSSRLALLTMAVLYDVGEPLTRDAIAERLIPRLDPYQRGYLEAWYQHHRGWQRKKEVLDGQRTSLDRPFERIVRVWLTQVFCQRTKGGTLERLPDGRYQPGRTAPRVMTLDGHSLAYTPEARHELERTEAEQGRQHLIGVELAGIVKEYAISTPAACSQFLHLLIRHLYLHVPKGEGSDPIDERKLQGRLQHLLKLADTPSTKRHVLQQAFDALLRHVSE
jgi:hypothetical protein